MRVLQVRNILLTQLSSNSLLLLFAKPTSRGRLVLLPVLPHVVPSPGTDEHELDTERHAGANGTGDITRCVGGFEDLTPRHVTHAVPDEGRRGDDSLFGTAGDVGRDCHDVSSMKVIDKRGEELTKHPREEKSDDERHGNHVHAPFRPFVFWGVGQEGHGEQADKRWNTCCCHDPHPSIGYFTRVDADDDEYDN